MRHLAYQLNLSVAHRITLVTDLNPHGTGVDRGLAQQFELYLPSCGTGGGGRTSIRRAAGCQEKTDYQQERQYRSRHPSSKITPRIRDNGPAANDNGGGAEDRSHRRRCLLRLDRKSTRLNSSHVANSYAVFCLKKKMITHHIHYS